MFEKYLKNSSSVNQNFACMCHFSKLEHIAHWQCAMCSNLEKWHIQQYKAIIIINKAEIATTEFRPGSKRSM